MNVLEAPFVSRRQQPHGGAHRHDKGREAPQPRWRLSSTPKCPCIVDWLDGNRYSFATVAVLQYRMPSSLTLCWPLYTGSCESAKCGPSLHCHRLLAGRGGPILVCFIGKHTTPSPIPFLAPHAGRIPTVCLSRPPSPINSTAFTTEYCPLFFLSKSPTRPFVSSS
jgi:hypothetical protein